VDDPIFSAGGGDLHSLNGVAADVQPDEAFRPKECHEASLTNLRLGSRARLLFYSSL